MKVTVLHIVPFGEHPAGDVAARLREIAHAIVLSGVNEVSFQPEQSKGADVAFQYTVEEER